MWRLIMQNSVLHLSTRAPGMYVRVNSHVTNDAPYLFRLVRQLQMACNILITYTT